MLQPDTVVVTAGTHFAISDRSGDIKPQSLHGFYAFDTRFLSGFQVEVQDRPLAVNGSGQLDHSAASFFSVNVGRRDLPAGAISVARDRYVAQGLHEDIALVNYSSRTRDVRLTLRFDADFADIFEVRRGTFRKQGSVTVEAADGYTLAFIYKRRGFQRRTLIGLTGEPKLNRQFASFSIRLEPGQKWKTCVTVLPVVDEPPPPMACVEQVLGPPFDRQDTQEREPMESLKYEQAQSLEDVPRLETGDSRLLNAYNAAVADLRSLRMEHVTGEPILAAGLPWFMAVFGRDSIISAIQTKLLGPELMAGTLRTLASLQATENDDFRESNPGKMPHEIRMGELSVMAETPHSRYYGTVDATPLFVRLLWETYLWTGDLELVRSFLPAARAAIGWLDTYGDVDGDGFIEYRRRTPHGLLNQGWKDSHDSISSMDGRQALGPIALVEVQGYAYDAKRCLADLLSVLGETGEAKRLEQEASRLKQAFTQAFWMPREGFFALALDGRKRAVDAIASNPGHLLWSGILDAEYATAVVERLMAPDLFSGWGIRTLSTEAGRYNPLSYHNGSVWPHDNSLIASGMARYGFHVEARRVAEAMIEASSHFPDHRLPELFGGYPRRAHSFPIPYPAANAPQAWACGAVIYLLETMLGIQVRAGKLEKAASRRHDLQLHGVPYRGMRLEL